MTRKELNELLDYEVGKKRDWRLRFYPEKHSVLLFRKSQFYASHKGLINKVIKRIYQYRLCRLYGILASPYAVIGKGLKFVHPTSIVIGSSVRAGENLHLYQNVTLGGSRIGDVKKGNQPTIGDNVTVFCGAAVLGKIDVGDDVVIAANSTLLSSVPDNAVCVGSPARVILKDK